MKTDKEINLLLKNKTLIGLMKTGKEISLIYVPCKNRTLIGLIELIKTDKKSV